MVHFSWAGLEGGKFCYVAVVRAFEVFGVNDGALFIKLVGVARDVKVLPDFV